MKKLIVSIMTIMMLAFASVALASNVGPQVPTSQKISEAYAAQWNNQQGKHTRVGIIYKNNAQTTYDDEIDYKVINCLVQAVNPNDHVMVDATTALNDLQSIGINDITMAERADLIDVLSKYNLDYAVMVQVDPFVRKERLSMFRYTLEMTSSIPVKIIDVKGNKYIFNGKFVEMAKHGSAVGSVSNKATVMKVLDNVCLQIYDDVCKIPKG